MRAARLGWILLAAAAAGCGASPTAAPAGGASPFTTTGEVRLGRFTRVFDKSAKTVMTVYNVVFSKTWEARRGAVVKDAFAQFVVPATSVGDDAPVLEALTALWQNGFFGLPRRTRVEKAELLAAGQFNDILVVETETTFAVVFQRDCQPGDPRRSFLGCTSVLENLLRVYPPLLVGGAVEKRNTFLGDILRTQGKVAAEDPPPGDAYDMEKRRVRIKPEAQRRQEEEERKEPPGPAPPTAPTEKPDAK
jgi:hypothetical protein